VGGGRQSNPRVGRRHRLAGGTVERDDRPDLAAVSLILPIWLVRTMTSWRGTREVLPALLVASGSFASMQYYWSNHLDTGLVDIVAAIFSLLVMVVFLKIWQPASVETVTESGVRPSTRHTHSTLRVLHGWSPFILSSVFIFLLGLQAVNTQLKFASLTVRSPVSTIACLKSLPWCRSRRPKPLSWI
jgi:lactate permease